MEALRPFLPTSEGILPYYMLLVRRDISIE